MYVTMPFLPNEFRSALKNIFLLYLYHSSDRKEVKNDKMFAVLIDEFKFLAETGIHVNVPEFTGLFHFSLGLLIGDNLGLHEMAGFAGGFTANHPCRICTISRQEMFTKCDDKSLLLRNKENYNLAIEQASLYETGINEPCVWNSIPNFHATENLGVDIMHDMMEGTSKYVLTAIINFYLKRGYFTLPFLNNRIEGFNYGLVDKSSKPPCLSSSSANEVNLKLSASESFIFVKYFEEIVFQLRSPREEQPSYIENGINPSISYDAHNISQATPAQPDPLPTKFTYPKQPSAQPGPLSTYLKQPQAQPEPLPSYPKPSPAVPKPPPSCLKPAVHKSSLLALHKLISQVRGRKRKRISHMEVALENVMGKVVDRILAFEREAEQNLQSHRNRMEQLMNEQNMQINDLLQEIKNNK
ncbi:hypothetical protein JTE90_013395 [Oedothorax gibbosus]|uniref:Uncharacterized protein n=1 Tax=Oedothorax gibbosus TaxID=931172 RepID=A0AAV6TUW8_9ARAC|nr:hypothetical protein JTE90_013395 [Oedothorax gibbosus]